MPAIAALWVMITVVVPSCSLTRAIAAEHDLAGLVVERAGRLVAQQHVGRLDDGAGDRDALLLAAGKLRGEMVEPLVRARPAPAPRAASSGLSAISFTSATFSQHGQARNQIVELKHEADMLAPVARQFGVVGADKVMVAPARLAGGRRVEPAEDVEQRRLAGTGRPEQHDEFAFVDVEIDVPERVDLDFAHHVGLGQVAGLKDHATGFALLPGLVQRHDVLLLPMRFNERPIIG